jgi:hypothetical protein
MTLAQDAVEYRFTATAHTAQTSGHPHFKCPEPSLSLATSHCRAGDAIELGCSASCAVRSRQIQ